jgi:hypothetical protein
MISLLIKELNTTIEGAYEMNYISVLNWLSYFKHRAEVENNAKKQNR